MELVECNDLGRGLKHDRLLLSKGKATVHSNPFFYGCIDNYLPENLYQRLLHTFPKNTLRINYKPDLTLDDDHPALRNFCDAGPDWKALLSFFTSERFLQDIQMFITPACLRERGQSQRVRGRWTYIPDWSQAAHSQDVTPIKINFKFSHLTAGEWSPPHTDLPCKLFSIIMYFPEPDWREEYGGGTEIYQPKYSVLNNNWNSAHAPFDLLNCLQSFAFVPNRLVFLLKTKNSWHGVSPLTCPVGKKRKSLLITFLTNIHRKRSPKVRFCKWVSHRVIRALMKFEDQHSQKV